MSILGIRKTFGGKMDSLVPKNRQNAEMNGEGSVMVNAKMADAVKVISGAAVLVTVNAEMADAVKVISGAAVSEAVSAAVNAVREAGDAEAGIKFSGVFRESGGLPSDPFSRSPSNLA